MTRLIAAGAVLLMTMPLPAGGLPEEFPPFPTWEAARERYLAVASEGQPSAEEAENGWDSFEAIATEARSLQKECEGRLPPDILKNGTRQPAWLQHSYWSGMPQESRDAAVAELVRIRETGFFDRTDRQLSADRYVRPIPETVTDDLFDLAKPVLNGARALALLNGARLVDASERGDIADAKGALRTMLVTASALASQPNQLDVLSAGSILWIVRDSLLLAVTLSPDANELHREMLRTLNAWKGLPSLDRLMRGEAEYAALEAMGQSHQFVKQDGPGSAAVLAPALIGEAAERRRDSALIAKAASIPFHRRAALDLDDDALRANHYFHVLKQHEAQIALLGSARTAVALECFRAEHGAFPDSLNALVPELLSEVPRDPCAKSGVITYRPSEDRTAYTLYAVGRDGEDNNGRDNEWADPWFSLIGRQGSAGTDAVFNAAEESR